MSAAQGVAQVVDGIRFYPLAPSVFPEGTSLRGQMMKMLKLLGLTVFVVCIAAFASGCGGGGGGSAMTPEEPPPVMECPQGQVGTYPNCMDPGPTDEQRIAAARQLLADILTDARSLAQMASSAAVAVQFHPDATAEQIDSASAQVDAAQAALTFIEGAVIGAGNAAITLAQAQTAVTDAQEALNDLTVAQSAAASIQSAVEAVASQRQQMQANEAALTNNSSLIKHVRANTLLSTAVLGSLAATSINVSPAGDTTRTDADTESCTPAPCAIFPANTGTGATAVTGQRTVSVQGITSNSTTPPLTGTGRLPHGFDLINAAATATTYVNAYTDITQTRLNVRTRTNVVEDTTPDDGVDQRYENRDFPDADYLIAGIWLTVNADISTSTINAFASGNQPIVATTTANFCSGIEETGLTGTTTRTCVAPTVNTIATIVDDGKDVTATYRGDANGAYIAGGATGYFTGDVELTAVFLNPTGTAANTGSIGGAVTNITAGGQSIAGSIELQTQTLADDISAAFDGGNAVGVVEGKSYSGNWKGRFFGHRVTRSERTETDRTDPNNITTTVTTTYSPEAPGSVAGTFFVKQLSNPAGSTAFIGAFGAHR